MFSKKEFIGKVSGSLTDNYVIVKVNENNFRKSEAEVTEESIE